MFIMLCWSTRRSARFVTFVFMFHLWMHCIRISVIYECVSYMHALYTYYYCIWMCFIYACILYVLALRINVSFRICMHCIHVSIMYECFIHACILYALAVYTIFHTRRLCIRIHMFDTYILNSLQYCISNHTRIRILYLARVYPHVCTCFIYAYCIRISIIYR